LGGVTISQGGVLPNVHSVLLPKKSQKESEEPKAPKEKAAKKKRE
jgi:hypothetical protein